MYIAMTQVAVHGAGQDEKKRKALCWPRLLDPETRCPNDAARGGRASLHAFWIGK